MPYALFDVLSGRFMDGRPVKSVDASTALRKSIQDHLVRLLNARQGVLPHLPDYGLPDMTAVYQEIPYSINALTASVKSTIERFEPRLKHVKVSSFPLARGDFVIHLQVSGTMINGEQIRFQTYFLSGGLAKVAVGGARAVTHA